MKRSMILLLLATTALLGNAAAATPQPVLGAAVSMGQPPASTIQANLTWSDASCAAAITVNTSGEESAGPCNAQVYRVASSSGAACPAFSTTAYTLVSGTVAQTATSGAYSDTTIVAGSYYCYAVTDTFQAGGAASSPSNAFQLFSVVPGGSPGAPTGLVVTTAP